MASYGLLNEINTTYTKSNYNIKQLNIHKKNEPTRLLKQGIWAYFLLLIFEGALRKWVLPGLATPLLVIRDPIALWLVLSAWSRNRLPMSPYLLGVTFIGTLGIFTAVLFGHGSLPVALFGARILLLHFPLIFVIGRIFTRDDVLKIGIATLWITIPMTILIAFQFYSPQSAWVNRGLGGDTAGAGFSGALGYFRPPGTFSFTNGTSLFYGFSACFISYFWLNHMGVNRLLLIAATIGLLSAIPLSISRSLFFAVGLSILFTISAVARKPAYFGRIILACIAVYFVIIILSQISFFQLSTEAFTSRFDTANEQEGGLNGVFIDRFLGGMVNAIIGTTNLPFWGYGLGIGTNVGSQLLTGERAFLISEGEWGRIIGELGVLLGIALILLRVSLTAKIVLASYRELRIGNLLPWILLSYGLISVSQGGWSQPTSLGFSVLIGGLLFASLRISVSSSLSNKDNI